VTDDPTPGAVPDGATPSAGDPSPPVDPPTDAELLQLLAGLPDPVMPDDVAARIDAALRTAPPVPTAAGGATVLPLDDARDKQVRRQAWSGRALGVAAGVAALLVVSGVVVSQLSGPSGSSGDLTAAGAEADVQTLAVVSSDTNYTEDALPQQLNTVLASAATELPTSAVTPTPTEGSDSVGFKDAPTGYQPALQQCVTGLTEGDESAPLVADYARFESQPALLVAVPGRIDVGTVEVFVVARGCTGGPDVRLYFYRVVPVGDLPALAGVTLPSPTTSP
jgi:hypothetical protein